MPQTSLELQRLVRHTLGSDEPPSEVSAIQIVNEAGVLLVSMRRWNWLDRPEYSLNLVGGQNWVQLPSDFGQIISVQTTRTLLGQATPTTLSRIQDFRSTVTNTPVGSYWYALEYEGSAAQAAPTPRLAIWPTPSVSSANALTLRYRAGWTTLSSDTDVAVIPTFCEPLLRQLVIAVARGYIEEDTQTLTTRVNELLQGGLFAMAIKEDAVSQVNLGQLRGGAVGARPFMPGFHNPDHPIPGPAVI